MRRVVKVAWILGAAFAVISITPVGDFSSATSE